MQKKPTGSAPKKGKPYAQVITNWILAIIGVAAVVIYFFVWRDQQAGVDRHAEARRVQEARDKREWCRKNNPFAEGCPTVDTRRNYTVRAGRRVSLTIPVGYTGEWYGNENEFCQVRERIGYQLFRHFYAKPGVDSTVVGFRVYKTPSPPPPAPSTCEVAKAPVQGLGLFQSNWGDLDTVAG